MNYKKRIKIKMGIYAGYFAIGIIMICTAFSLENNFLSSLGAAFTVIGIAKFIRVLKMFKKPELMKNAEISENDERNIYIYHCAQSLAFTLTGILTAVGIIISGIMNEILVMKTLSYFLCGALLIYVISYYIIRKKS